MCRDEDTVPTGDDEIHFLGQYAACIPPRNEYVRGHVPIRTWNMNDSHLHCGKLSRLSPMLNFTTLHSHTEKFAYQIKITRHSASPVINKVLEHCCTYSLGGKSHNSVVQLNSIITATKKSQSALDLPHMCRCKAQILYNGPNRIYY